MGLRPEQHEVPTTIFFVYPKCETLKTKDITNSSGGSVRLVPVEASAALERREHVNKCQVVPPQPASHYRITTT